MITIDFKFVFGFTMGFEFFPPDYDSEPDVEWAFLLHFGIIQIGIGKVR